VSVVFLFIGKVAQVPHGQEGRPSLDHAFEAEGQQRQAAGADRLEQRQGTLPEDVEKRQAEQPVHPLVQRPALFGREDLGRRRVEMARHGGILFS
jgi:hypothetical protein